MSIDPYPHRLPPDMEELDGHSLEELTDYLDAGRSPADPSIDDSPGCRLALEALERLRVVAKQSLEDEAREHSAVEENWVQGILSRITLEARAGRRIPLASPSPHADLGITEGAVRGLVRGAEDALPGLLIGRVVLDGDVTVPEAPVSIRVDASVPYGEPIPDLADRLRLEVTSRLRLHTELNVTRIDITVHDVRFRTDSEDER